MKKQWYDYLWIFSAAYLVLGIFNILFAWLGLICFITPLAISIVKGDKAYCNKYCGRGQLFQKIGGDFGLSRKKNPPQFLRSTWFRYGLFDFLYDNVWAYDLQYGSSFCGCKLKRSSNASLGFQITLELGQYFNGCTMDRSVCIWFL